MKLDSWFYELPGEVLTSHETPTKKLDSAPEIAEALDTYVQPRFAILRDRSFGAIRIVYRKHAGIVQLKVNTPQEKALIANINASGHDYAIGLFHCAPKPNRLYDSYSGNLELLYIDQQQVVQDKDGHFEYRSQEIAKTKHIPWSECEERAKVSLPLLIAGKEKRDTVDGFSLLMRPVLASKPACLTCHTNAKLGATLGVMVYTVRTTK